MKKANRIFALLLVLVCLFAMTVPAFAVGSGYNVISKVLIQISNPPVALMDPATIQATTSTEGCVLTSMAWYNMYSQPITTAFTTERVTLVINAGTYGGYVFADSVAAYINNEPVICTVSNGGASLTVTRDYAPGVWSPSINKHPSADKVDEGGTVSFVASASYATGSTWKVLDANGQLWTPEQLALTFPNFTYHESLGKLVMNGVPKNLDGAQFCCTFEGPGGKVDTNWAPLKVKYEVVETPAPTPTPTPTPTATPKPTPTPTPKVEEHVHSFPADWEYDGDIHWHECECGEQKDFAPHEFKWETVEEATRKAPGKEKGVCTVCGYEKEQEIKYEGFTLNEKTIKIIVIAVAAVLVLVALLLIVLKIKRKKELERRRREALRRRRHQKERERREE